MGKVKEQMGEFKEQLLEAYSGLPSYTEEQSVEQEISVGDVVRVYDSSILFTPKQGVILYKKEVLDHSILDIDLGPGGIVQVYEIQCIKLNKRLPRILWLRFNTETESYEVSVKKPEAGELWAKFKEEL